MAVLSTIEWTDATWNPVRGCTKISPGCAHCYASTFSERFRGVPGHPFEQGFDLRLVPEKLLEPLRWSRQKRIFVNSMSDLFHDGISSAYIEAVLAVMVDTPWHTYQILTKRAERLSELSTTVLKPASTVEHIWWGVSVENKKHGLRRIDVLRDSNVRNRFLSIEPLLEDLGRIDLEGIGWVIVGGESGHGARPMSADWVRALRDQCSDAGIPFFFKQWGGVQKKRAGRLLDGRLHDEMPPEGMCSVPTASLRSDTIKALSERLKMMGQASLVQLPTQDGVLLR